MQSDKSHAAAVEFAATHFEQYGLSHLQIGHPWTGVTLADALRAFTPSHEQQNAAPAGEIARKQDGVLAHRSTPPAGAAPSTTPQKPVAWRWRWNGGDEPDVWSYCEYEPNTKYQIREPLYAAPVALPSATACSADARDAARYRRARESSAWYDDFGRKLWGEELDAAIDAAMNRADGGKQTDG